MTTQDIRDEIAVKLEDTFSAIDVAEYTEDLGKNGDAKKAHIKYDPDHPLQSVKELVFATEEVFECEVFDTWYCNLSKEPYVGVCDDHVFVYCFGGTAEIVAEPKISSYEEPGSESNESESTTYSLSSGDVLYLPLNSDLVFTGCVAKTKNSGGKGNKKKVGNVYLVVIKTSKPYSLEYDPEEESKDLTNFQGTNQSIIDTFNFFGNGGVTPGMEGMMGMGGMMAGMESMGSMMAGMESMMTGMEGMAGAFPVSSRVKNGRTETTQIIDADSDYGRDILSQIKSSLAAQGLSFDWDDDD